MPNDIADSLQLPEKDRRPLMNNIRTQISIIGTIQFVILKEKPLLCFDNRILMVDL